MISLKVLTRTHGAAVPRPGLLGAEARCWVGHRVCWAEVGMGCAALSWEWGALGSAKRGWTSALGSMRYEAPCWVLRRAKRAGGLFTARALGVPVTID